MPYQAARTRITDLHNRYEKYYPAAFFVAGFVFDILTLDRIDNVFLILQQAIYILFIGWVLYFQTLEKLGRFDVTTKTSFFGRQFQKMWRYHNEALHFVLGSLLSIYFLFYFVSSSLATSFFFLIAMFVVLVANELPRFQGEGPWLKYILYWLCVFSFFSVLVPVAVGFTNVVTLLVAVGLGLAMAFSVYRAYERKLFGPTAAAGGSAAGRSAAGGGAAGGGASLAGSADASASGGGAPLAGSAGGGTAGTAPVAGLATPLAPDFDLKKNIAAPAVGVASVLLILYFLKLLPPLPLSIQYIGVYHGIAREGEHYVLSYDRPWYKFWQSGAQTFLAQPGDRIHVFARIFSPSTFRDQIVFHWQIHGPSGWQSSDRVNASIVGGRDQGFRAYSTKSNFEAGAWRVKVETPDGREIGRITFDVEKVAESPREYEFDRY